MSSSPELACCSYNEATSPADYSKAFSMHVHLQQQDTASVWVLKKLSGLVALQMVRTLSTPEPLPVPEAAPESQTAPGPMHTVASLGAWNVNEVPHIETPVTPPDAPALPKGLPDGTNLAAQASGTPREQLAGAAERLPGPAAQLPEEPLGPAAPPPEKAPAALELASLNAEDAAELLADPPALPTIKEEETPAAQPAAESGAVPCPSVKPQLST